MLTGLLHSCDASASAAVKRAARLHALPGRLFVKLTDLNTDR
jgi:hypothetical protein